jgi:hypothetical protein
VLTQIIVRSSGMSRQVIGLEMADADSLRAILHAMYASDTVATERADAHQVEYWFGVRVHTDYHLCTAMARAYQRT